MKLVPDPQGHVSLSDLIQRGFEPISLETTTGQTHINYSKIHCGNCDEIMSHIKDIAGKGSIFTTWRYCKKCQILIKFAKLEVIRIRFE